MQTITPDPRSHWDPIELRRVAHRVADLLADYLTGVDSRPVFTPVPPDHAARFPSEPTPSAGASPDAILDEFERAVARYPFGNGHPRFWGWINSPPAVIGVFADALAAAMNPSVAGGNHAAVHVERQVVRWFAEIVGLPETAMGLLVSGGSMANLTALAAARHAKAGFDVRARGLQSGDPKLVAYMSQEGHGCVRKAIELLGLGSDALRVIPVNDRFEMDVSALSEAIDGDLDAGHRPIAVAASAGTVNSGAIDPLEAIARGLRDFYRGAYQDVYMSRRQDVEKAVAGTQQIYRRNVFPEMNVQFGTYPNNVGHMDFPGCFRCHDDNHKAKDGRKISQDCDTCHKIE